MKNIQNTQITKEIESVEHLNKNFSVIVIDSCEYLHVEAMIEWHIKVIVNSVLMWEEIIRWLLYRWMRS